MKLTYFDLRGRGEPIRFILAAAGVKYDDNRINSSDWPALKADMPWGQLPVLELDDGSVIAESLAICRYLARTYNLAGSSDIEAAKCDEYVYAFMDIIKDWIDFTWDEKNAEIKAEKQKKFLETSCPNFFGKLNRILEENGGTFLVGKALTWADIFIGCCCIQDMEITCGPNLTQKYQKIQEMRNAVRNIPNIKAWIEQRPSEDLMAILKSFQN